MSMIRLYARVLGLLGAEKRLAVGLFLANVALSVAAFAEPEQPGFGDEQGFALLTRHRAPVLAAIGELFATFSAAAGLGDAPEAAAEARPRPRRKGTGS